MIQHSVSFEESLFRDPGNHIIGRSRFLTMLCRVLGPWGPLLESTFVFWRSGEKVQCCMSYGQGLATCAHGGARICRFLPHRHAPFHATQAPRQHLLLDRRNSLVHRHNILLQWNDVLLHRHHSTGIIFSWTGTIFCCTGIILYCAGNIFWGFFAAQAPYSITQA